MVERHGSLQVTRAIGIAVVVLACTVAFGARDARAFPTGNQFDGDPLTSDGAGGIAFDGAPRWTSHDCSVCHTDPPGIISLALDSDHPELFTTGWTANQQYHLRVILENEWADAGNQALGDDCGFNSTTYTPCDDNGFALEMDDPNGKPVGSYVPVVGTTCATTGETVPPDVDVRVLTDGTAVTHNGAHSGMVQWDFCWTAPAAGTGVITAYLATVDGNGGSGSNFPNDTLGDDVAVGAVPLAEKGAAPPSEQTGGCNVSGGDARGDVGAIVIVGAIGALLMRRRRKAVATMLAIGAISALSACTHVRATQRETLANKNMKFGPDPTEDELDLHMQEAREGSQGGYGSSGGGCGCN
jgi:MYXO-CTERM domain-containing protein